MDILDHQRGLYTFGPFRLDPVRRALVCGGAPVRMAERLFDTLLYLVAHHGRVVDREELLRAVWAGRVVEDSNVGQAIFELRKLLRAGAPEERFIVTVAGRGYRFAAPVAMVARDAGPDGGDANCVAADPLPGANRALAGENSARADENGAAADADVPAPWPMRTLVIAAAGALLLGLAILIGGPWRETSALHGAGSAFDPPAHSVAVLAFDNMTGDPAQNYISDGLSEQVIDALTRVDALQVAARTSSFSFRGKPATIGEIARTLNVGAVLEGSVRRDGNRLRITAQLINARTGYHFWSRTYDRHAEAVLDVELDIAQAVTRSLQIALLGDGAAILSLGGTTNPAAFDAYLRGVRLQVEAGDPAGMRAALAQLDSAVGLDPGFARGYAARAFARARLGDMGGITDPAALRQDFTDALADADRAVALAPTLAAAHSVRGQVLLWGSLDLAGDAAEQARALDLSPGNATIERNYAESAVVLGHIGEAVDAARRATLRDPMAPGAWFTLAHTLYLARRYDEAAATLRHAEAVTGTMPVQQKYLLGKAELMRGQPEAARLACAEGRGWLEDMVLAMALRALGRTDEAAAHLAAIQARLHDAGAYNYAVVYAQWGQREDALRWLQTAWRLRDPGLIDIKVNPMLDPLRDAAVFQDIERRVLAQGG